MTKKQILKFITMPYWLLVGLLTILIIKAWKLDEDCPRCEWLKDNKNKEDKK